MHEQSTESLRCPRMCHRLSEPCRSCSACCLGLGACTIDGPGQDREGDLHRPQTARAVFQGETTPSSAQVQMLLGLAMHGSITAVTFDLATDQSSVTLQIAPGTNFSMQDMRTQTKTY